jgi:hypothetical protein
LENSTEISKKIRNRTTIFSNSASGYIPKQNEISMSKRCLHSYVYYSTMHNSLDRETKSKCPLRDKWIKKENSSSCDMDKSGRYCVK